MLFLENLVFRAKEDAKFFYLQFMVSMASPVVEAHKKLLDEWSKEKRDLVKVEKLLEELRVMTYYASTPEDSDHKYLMIGLNLIFLVASNRLSQFHMLLEQIPQDVQRNPFIAVPVTIEQALMEGAYNKIALTERHIPSPFFSPFLSVMNDAVRAEIAACMAKSFKKVLVADAVSLLIFKTKEEVVDYAKKRGWPLLHNDTLIDLSKLTVMSEADSKPTLESARIAKQTIFYAKQLEMIV